MSWLMIKPVQPTTKSTQEVPQMNAVLQALLAQLEANAFAAAVSFLETEAPALQAAINNGIASAAAHINAKLLPTAITATNGIVTPAAEVATDGNLPPRTGV